MPTPELVRQHLGVLKQALQIRFVEETLLQLFSEGKLFGTVHTCIGQEFTGIAVAQALKPQDYVFSNHRGHGHFLACCGDVEGLIAEVMGKTTGVCGGRGGSQHLCRGRFFSNGVQGGIAPLSAGLALAQKLGGLGGIAVVFLGDGTLGEGVLYESMNLASKWELPLLFVLENNHYAQSTNQAQTLAGGIEERFHAFGIETTTGDTWNWPQLLAGMQESVDRVRSQQKPHLHRVDTYRLKAHSKGDDNRPPEEVEIFWKKDPLSLIVEQLGGEEPLRSDIAAVRAEVERAVARAEAAPFPDEVAAAPPAPGPPVVWEPRAFGRERVTASIRRALDELLAANPRAFLLGEDIEGPYGGAFKVTGDLSQKYSGRVRNTPISEAAITGVGTGLALGGHRPVVEIMFGDFLALAADQIINHAAKLEWMYNHQVRVPVVVRTPMGGKRGYGPTHSQSLEKHFLGLPGMTVLCLHHRDSPYLLYRQLLFGESGPTLVIENKVLYAQHVEPAPPAGFELVHSRDDYPVSWLRPTVPADLTMLVVGGMGLDAEKAVLTLFTEEEVVSDLLLPSRLYPFDVRVLEDSLSRTRRLLVVEEGQGFAAFGSEILAQVAERYAHLNPVCRRLSATANPIPSSRPEEARSLPGPERIVAAALEVVRGG